MINSKLHIKINKGFLISGNEESFIIHTRCFFRKDSDPYFLILSRFFDHY